MPKRIKRLARLLTGSVKLGLNQMPPDDEVGCRTRHEGCEASAGLSQPYFDKGCSGIGVPSGNGIFAVFKNIATML